MASDSNSSSFDSEVHSPNSNQDLNPDSIDQSLDAIENRLVSISMSSHPEMEPFDQEEEQPEPMEQLTTTIGLMNGEIGEEVVVDEIKEEEQAKSSLKAEASKVIEASSVWRNNSVEEATSPSSSGYAGEGGSSGDAASVGDEIKGDEIKDDDAEVRSYGVLRSQEQWTRGKRNLDEVS